MTPSDLFLESRVNRADHRVYGFRLHPLCLLDLVALEAAGSPVLQEGADVRDWELALAAFILSRPIDESLSVHPVKIPRSMSTRIFCMNFKRQLAAFDAYLTDYLTSVELYREETDGGKTLGSHWIQSVATYLSRNTSMTQREIWTSPIGQVLWMSAAIEEQTGSARVKTSEDEALEAAAVEAAERNAKLKGVEIEQIKNKLQRADLSATERARLVARLAKLEGHTQ